MGHVFAGLAASELGRPAEARQHYRTAISLLPSEPLAWKVSISCYVWLSHQTAWFGKIMIVARTYRILCAIFPGFTQFRF